MKHETKLINVPEQHSIDKVLFVCSDDVLSTKANNDCKWNSSQN